MDCNVPKYWKMKSKVPFGYPGYNEKEALFGVAMFKGKRAILFNRALDFLSTMETRYANKLIDEAESEQWIKSRIESTTLGPRLETYPKKADFVIIFDYNFKKNTCNETPS